MKQIIITVTEADESMSESQTEALINGIRREVRDWTTTADLTVQVFDAD